MARLVLNLTKLGHSLTKISELTRLTEDEVKETLGQATGLTPKHVDIILDMTKRRLTLEQITHETGVELEILKQFLPEVIGETVETHALAERSTPTTTEVTHRALPTSLLITGGESSREVVKIDTLRECAVSSVPPMPTAKHDHAAVYHAQYLYVLGGVSYRDLSECERNGCAESRWEELPGLPVAGWCMSAVELENSLYALGGQNARDLDTVQKLSLDSLTWMLMEL
jgi:hypothetical protein